MNIVISETVAPDLGGLVVERVSHKKDKTTKEEVAVYEAANYGPRFTVIHPKASATPDHERQVAVVRGVRRAMGDRVKYNSEKKKFTLGDTDIAVSWCRGLARFVPGTPTEETQKLYAKQDEQERKTVDPKGE